MRAILRVERLLLAAGLGLLAVPALAQTATAPATTNQPAPTTAAPAANAQSNDAIGPRELQNFSLPGTATHPAPQQSVPTTTPSAAATKATPVQVSPSPARRVVESRQPARPATPVSSKAAPFKQAPAAGAGSATAPETAPLPAPSSSVIAPAAEPPPAPVPLAPAHRLPILPWLIAALLLAAGTAFLLWRRRPRPALAAGDQFDLLAAPEPEAEPAAAAGVRWMPAPKPEQPGPTAVPAPPPGSRPFAPQRPAAEAPRGIVASRLRPALEIGVRPLRCLVEDGQVTLEFELDLFNAGTAPARAILAEASLLNASATQDQELAAFFSRPAAQGEPIEAIPPMKRMTMTSQVVAPRAAIQEYDLGGRRAFVPVIAFNALYEWSSGKGQTSAAYLVGRETKGEKLGPIRLDNGTSELRGLGARSLPVGIRN
jgi:hypothetical protein